MAFLARPMPPHKSAARSAQVCLFLYSAPLGSHPASLRSMSSGNSGGYAPGQRRLRWTKCAACDAWLQYGYSMSSWRRFWGSFTEEEWRQYYEESATKKQRTDEGPTLPEPDVLDKSFAAGKSEVGSSRDSEQTQQMGAAHPAPQLEPQSGAEQLESQADVGATQQGPTAQRNAFGVPLVGMDTTLSLDSQGGDDEESQSK